jgi:hypothetical protein
MTTLLDLCKANPSKFFGIEAYMGEPFFTDEAYGESGSCFQLPNNVGLGERIIVDDTAVRVVYSLLHDAAVVCTALIVTASRTRGDRVAVRKRCDGIIVFYTVVLRNGG